MVSQLRVLRPLQDENLTRQTDFIAQSLLNLNKVPLLNGLLLTSVVLANGANTVPHKLGRSPQGWLVTRLRASATIYETSAFDASFLYLTTSAGVTVDLWVF